MVNYHISNWIQYISERHGDGRHESNHCSVNTLL